MSTIHPAISTSPPRSEPPYPHANSAAEDSSIAAPLDRPGHRRPTWQLVEALPRRLHASSDSQALVSPAQADHHQSRWWCASSYVHTIRATVHIEPAKRRYRTSTVPRSRLSSESRHQPSQPNAAPTGVEERQKHLRGVEASMRLRPGSLVCAGMPYLRYSGIQPARSHGIGCTVWCAARIVEHARTRVHGSPFRAVHSGPARSVWSTGTTFIRGGASSTRCS